MPAIISAPVLKEVVEALYVVTDEARLRFGSMGLGAAAVDQSNTCLVALSLDPKAFESYDLEEAEIGVDLKKLRDVLSGASGDDKVELDHESGAKRLDVRYGHYSYRLGLLDVGSLRKEPKLPATVVLNGGTLRDIVHDAAKVADKIALIAEKGVFKAIAEDELDSFTAELPESMLISMDVEKPAKACFSLEILGSLSKAYGKSDRATLNLANDMPCKISSTFAGGNGTLTYFVAPWVEGEG